MSANPKPDVNVKQVVPFFGVSDMERSLRFYLEGLQFTIGTNGRRKEKSDGAGWNWVVRR